MPNVFGKESKKKELVNNLGEIYQKIEREHQISPGDFPSLRKMQVQSPDQILSALCGAEAGPGCWAVVLEGTTKGSSWVSHQFPTRIRVDLGRDTDTKEGNVVTQPGGAAWLSMNLHCGLARMGTAVTS